MIFKNKKVLVFGFGILGGGLATTNWLLKQGAKVTVTDLKTEAQLKDSLSKIKGKAILKLAGHEKKDIEEAEIIVVNPDVSVRNEFIQYALNSGKEVVNESVIFFEQFKKPIVGVTGTRGKTTTTAWTNYLLGSQFKSTIVGNSSERPFLKILDLANDYELAVAEVSSFHLELWDHVAVPGPKVAIITNIYQDHLNRHQTLEEYARVKANIFKYQTTNDHLILNGDNSLIEFFKKCKPKAHVWVFSLNELPENQDGVWAEGEIVYFQKDGRKEQVLSLHNIFKSRGQHNLYNFLASSLATHLLGCSWRQIQSRMDSLPEIPFRQEIIFQNSKLTVVNDTTATSPEGGIPAVKRFGGSETILITGGTDRDLDFSEWVVSVRQNIEPSNIVFLAGSATEKMRHELGGFASKIKPLETLEECVSLAFEKSGQFEQSVVLFSPACKSFEKFKNEFDRGQQFNDLVKKYGPDRH